MGRRSATRGSALARPPGACARGHHAALPIGERGSSGGAGRGPLRAPGGCAAAPPQNPRREGAAGQRDDPRTRVSAVPKRGDRLHATARRLGLLLWAERDVCHRDCAAGGAGGHPFRVAGRPDVAGGGGGVCAGCAAVRGEAADWHHDRDGGGRRPGAGGDDPGGLPFAFAPRDAVPFAASAPVSAGVAGALGGIHTGRSRAHRRERGVGGPASAGRKPARGGRPSQPIGETLRAGAGVCASGAHL